MTGTFPSQHKGFTLAELLIALAILGVIATFTIPKVLQAQQTAQYNSIAKEAVAMVSGAYEAYKVRNSVTSSTGLTQLTPYMNYVALDTTSTLDHVQTLTTLPQCNGTTILCYKLHSGATLAYQASNSAFGGTDSDDATFFYLDPDGRETDGTTNGPGKSIQFWIYANGKIRTRGTIDDDTLYGGVTPTDPDTSYDPPWFSWGQ